MARTLPPLKALHVFETAARLLSFTHTAEELGVTQGAVSKQIALLEEHLGIRLFLRTGKQLRLSPEAAAYAGALTDSFDHIVSATEALSGNGKATETLTVNILPSLSSRWLIPLLEDFRKKYPRYSVRLEIGDGPVDFSACTADIAIRAARRHLWKPLMAEVLMGEELLPIARPDVLAARPVRQPRDFEKLTLLEHTTRPGMWQEYLSTMGVKSPNIRHRLGFEHFFMLIQAAQDGLGAALIPRFLITRELAEGSLMIAYAKPYQSPYRYYLICQKRMMETRRVRAFRRWLTEKIQDHSITYPSS